MTTRQRLDLLSRAYPRLFPRADLIRLLRAQLGSVDALDSWIRSGGANVRARAPQMIYHVCAGNLAISAVMSLMQGILLGAHNVVKLPGDRDDATARREIVQFIGALPASLRKFVEIHRTLNLSTLNRADVVVAFGSDATMAALRAQTLWTQKFVAHGHALSLLWLAQPDQLTPRQSRAIARDILTYDQLGCLSPQAIYLSRGANISTVGDKLAAALEAHWLTIQPKPTRPISVAARIVEARDVAHAMGHRVWLPPRKHLGWTLVHDPDSTFQPSPLHGVIYLRSVAESKLSAALASVAGRISTVGLVGEISSRLETAFLSLGVSRFCPAGHMQFPPLTWHHDGRPTLGDLVTWVDAEGVA